MIFSGVSIISSSWAFICARSSSGKGSFRLLPADAANDTVFVYYCYEEFYVELTELVYWTLDGA